MSTILAIDPSLTCTGWAVLHGPDTVPHFGLIRTPKAKPFLDRVVEVCADLASLVVTYSPGAVVIETPATVMAGGRHRAVVSGATYGFLAGAAYAHLMIAARVPVEGVAATVWTKSLGPAVSRTRGDPHKQNRVRAVEYMVPALKGMLGPKTTAGNIADAILLGRWWFNQQQTRRKTA